MPVWKLQCAFGGDSSLPRDKAIITPHFTSALLSDPQSICDDLAAALLAWSTSPREVTVKAYDAQGAAPVYPQGEAVVSANVNPESDVPREIAVCLSFYADRNIPRHRGRLYVPAFVVGAGVGVRPSVANRTRVAELAPILADLGGLDVDWCVYSKSDNVARTVKAWWVDDEWDTVRSRGLRATTRTVGSTSG